MFGSQQHENMNLWTFLLGYSFGCFLAGALRELYERRRFSRALNQYKQAMGEMQDVTDRCFPK